MTGTKAVILSNIINNFKGGMYVRNSKVMVLLDSDINIEGITEKKEIFEEVIIEANVEVTTFIEKRETCFFLMAIGERYEIDELIGYLEDNYYNK